MTDKKIDSLKHKKATRARIPSKEEAGCEPDQPSKAELPLNPVTTRGQDPELYWLEKYGAEDDRGRPRPRHPLALPHRTHRPGKTHPAPLPPQARGNPARTTCSSTTSSPTKDIDELDKPTYYYKQADQWANRLIQGDSLLVMGSLLEREGMKGQVQMIYIDPPYGIKYNSNWQIRVGDRNVKDGDDASL
jgi:adenine-specific DNA-methyltransferase